MNTKGAISYADAIWDDFVKEPGLAEACIAEIEQAYTPPRHPDLVCEFIAEHLPDGEIYVYGAGTHTEFILPLLRQRPGITVLGIVDMRAGEDLRHFQKFDVIAPADLTGLNFDYVLLSHADREAEMTASLAAAGVAAERISPLYGSTAFRDFAFSRRETWPTLPPRDNIENVIVSTTYAHTTLIPDDALQQVLPPETTLELYMGRQTEWGADSRYEKVNLYQSLALLSAFLEHFRPTAVYLRGTVQASLPLLPVYLHIKHPDIRLVNETYDVGCFVEDHRLSTIWGFTHDTIRQARLGEVFSFRHAHAVVHKNVGALWDSFSEHCEAPQLTYFPGVHQGLELPPPPRRNTSDPIQIAYPGGLSPYGDVISPDIAFTLEYLATIRDIAAQDGVHFHLYNHKHRSAEDDAKFDYYVKDFRDAGIEYHTRVTHEVLVRDMSQYDFGWLYFEETPIFQQENIWRVGLPNKFTDYVQAGLPTIVTDMFESVAELVERYHAGIVLSAHTPELLGDLIRDADISALRDGARKLREDMLGTNQRTLDVLHDLFITTKPAEHQHNEDVAHAIN